jgi:hypothetical protein
LPNIPDENTFVFMPAPLSGPPSKHLLADRVEAASVPRSRLGWNWDEITKYAGMRSDKLGDFPQRHRDAALQIGIVRILGGQCLPNGETFAIGGERASSPLPASAAWARGSAKPSR